MRARVWLGLAPGREFWGRMVKQKRGVLGSGSEVVWGRIAPEVELGLAGGTSTHIFARISDLNQDKNFPSFFCTMCIFSCFLISLIPALMRGITS